MLQRFVATPATTPTTPARATVGTGTATSTATATTPAKKTLATTVAAPLSALLGAAALLVAASVVARADVGPADLAPVLAGRDSLTVAVAGVGEGVDGTYRLVCAADGAPDGGTHPNAAGACAKLAELAAKGQDPFAAAPRGAMCTMIYGGPATAHVTGTWQGREIDADFRRSDGCAVGRWNALVPVLPSVGATAAR